jgi:TRAP-type C4-dicarboxylate transport system permease small subunit
MATVLEKDIQGTANTKRDWLFPLQALNHGLTVLETFAVTVLTLCMLGLGITQIAMWNLFHQGLAWADPVLRHMVLWVAMIGASMATSARRHLNMDALTRILPPKGKAIAGVFVHLTAAAVTGVLSWVSCIFVSEEMATGGLAFLNVSRWQAQLILPIAFGLMAFRFLISSLEDLRKAL